MVKSIVNAMSRDPLDLILSSLKDGIDFDKENSTEDETKNQGRDHAVSLAIFLWLIYLNKIPEIKCVVPEDDDLQVYLKNRNKECLDLPVPVSIGVTENLGDQGNVLKQLSASISNQVESSKESNKLCRLEFERKLEQDSDKNDSMIKLHASVLHTFLMAASENGEEKAADVP